MSKTNLKPCPKCGGNATVIWEEGENYRVECVDCPRHGGLYRTEEEAVAAWNRLPRVRHTCGECRELCGQGRVKWCTHVMEVVVPTDEACELFDPKDGTEDAE